MFNKFALAPKLVLTLVLIVFVSQGNAANEEIRLNVATAMGPTSLDPYSVFTEENIQLAHLVFDPLTRWANDGKIELRLAESIEPLDPLTWRVKIKKGVLFHSGNPLTAKDVVWTINRIRESPTFRVTFMQIESVQAVDSYTVDFRTNQPFGLMLNVLAYVFPMDSLFYTGKDEYGQDKGRVEDATKNTNLSPEEFAAKPRSFASTHASGTGPFIVTKNDSGKKLELKAFDNYWTSRGNVNSLTLTAIVGEAARISALLSGTVDFIMPVPPQDYVSLNGSPDVQFFAKSSPRIILIQFNMNGAPALRNKLVRQAIIDGVDNFGIVNNILNKSTEVASQFPTPNMPGHVASLKASYNPSKAKALLAEAGYAGKPINLTMIAPNNRYVSDEKIAMAFAGMMQRIGVNIELTTMPREKYWDEFRRRKADLALFGLHPVTMDTASYFEYLLMCYNPETGLGAYNSGNYCNPELDKLIIESGSIQNAKKRDAILAKAVMLAHDDAAFIPLHYEPYSWAANQKVTNADNLVSSVNFAYFGDAILEVKN